MNYSKIAKYLACFLCITIGMGGSGGGLAWFVLSEALKDEDNGEEIAIAASVFVGLVVSGGSALITALLMAAANGAFDKRKESEDPEPSTQPSV